MPSSIKPIRCQDSVALVSASRDQSISVEQTEQLNHHLAHCPRCQVARQQFSALFGALDELLANTSDSET